MTVWQGSGPQNVRDLFERARRYAPTIVFIDEIDAVGLSRSGSASGRAQENTLNALLTEMEGFSSRKDQPTIVLAATNLAEQLDDALKRRFDRVIEVDRTGQESSTPLSEKSRIGTKALLRLAQMLREALRTNGGTDHF